MTSTEELQRLAQLLEAANMTRRQAAMIGGVAEQTLFRWFSGRRKPDPAMVAGVTQRVAESALTRVKLRDGHHLYYKPDCGWMLRATIQVSSKKIGKRVKRSLGTHDVFEAINRRNQRIDEWRRLGLHVANRKQKPWKES